MTKADLRRVAMQKRTLRDGRVLGEQISRRLIGSPLLEGADAVLLYVAVRGEIDLSPLAEELASRGTPLAYPRTERGGVMTFHIKDPAAPLTVGRYGIPEPPAHAPAPHITPRTVCLVPALAYDEYGYRIGYGGGYYDRFLKEFCGISIGIAEAVPNGIAIPRDPFDLPVMYLADPHGVRTPKTEDSHDPATENQ